MINVVGVRFRSAGKIYFFDPGEFSLPVDTYVIVETVRGMEMGKVVLPLRKVTEDQVVLPLKKVQRVASPEDLEKM